GYTDALGSNNFAVLRLNTNGSEDGTFGPAGERTADFGGDDRAFAVALQVDGKIVVAGQGTGIPVDFCVARVTSTTGLDSSFDGDGKKNITFGNVDIATGVAIQKDGKILVGGYTNQDATGGNPNNFVAARLTTSGALDTTFNDIATPT